MTLHPVLARQLRRLALDASRPPDAAQWQSLLARIDRAYRDADEDRYLAERSLEVVSQEMQDLYEDLRLRSESDLEEERDRLQAIIGSLGDGLCVLDRGGHVVLLNVEAARLTGTAPQVALGRDLVDLGWTSAEHGARLRAACRRALGNREAAQCEDLEFHDQHGRSFPVSCAISPVLHGGQVTGLVLMFRDVTDQRRARADLVKARDDAEAATRAKTEFLATMSHELRTPLNGIIGMSSLLLDTPLDTTQQEYTSTIRTCAEGLVSVVSDILDLSKIEAGRFELDRAGFDLHELVEDTVAVVAVSAHRRGLEVIADVAPEVPRFVVGDAPRLKQVMLNLLANAVKFTERGEVAIVVTAEAAAPVSGARTDPSPDGRALPLRIEVRDTGVGIAPDTLPRLFESYAQADPSTSRRFGGTGLGLAISRRLVALMGGDLHVRSQIGLGTTFSVDLPTEVDRTAQPDPAPAYLPCGARVLCVDDCARQRQLIAGHVTALGLRCATARHAGAALDQMRDAAHAGDPFAAVLVDRHMPSTSGLELVRLIRAEPLLASTAVLLVTPLGEGLAEDGLGELNLAGQVVKPVRRAALAEALRGALGWKDPEHSRNAQRVPHRFEGPGGRRRRVLVAEDDAVNQRVILAQLRRLGIEASLARNGVEAVAAASNGDYDLVLMDCQMPEMDGYEATRAIRGLGNGASGVPILALTASALTSDRDDCLAAGMNAHLTKPIDHERLARALSRWLPRSDAA